MEGVGIAAAGTIAGPKQEPGGRKAPHGTLPVFVLVNHALADGRHIAQFYETLEKRLNRAKD